MKDSRNSESDEEDDIDAELDNLEQSVRGDDDDDEDTDEDIGGQG
jgi:hypothetical protein